MFRKEVKRLLAVLLILALMGGMLPGWDYSIKAYAADTASGEWSSSEYITEPDLSGSIYTIDSPGDLAWVASQVNSGSTTFIGYTFSVTADIDLSAHYWTPVGRSTTIAFKGIFNGNNKVISGLTIGSSASPNSTTKNTGLFGFVSGSTITGVILDNAVIYSSIASPYVGGLVAETKGVTTISGCSATGLFYCSGSGGNIGGILGYYSDYNAGRLTVVNCYSQCAIYSPKVSNAGGLVASVFSNESRKTNIRNCFATGSITGGGYMNTSTGGFIGSCQYANIYNCFSNCTVDGKSCYTGGFAGMIYKSSLSNVYAAGLVNNVYTEGGVVGKNSYPNTNPMSNCYWNSTVNSGTTTYGVGNAASNDYTMALPQNYMQSSDFLSDLNGNAAALVTAGNTDILSWELDTDKNSGFPRLSGIGVFSTIYKPVAVGLSIGGTVRVKETLTLSYDYLDYNGYPENGSTIQWYRSDSADGSGAGQISGAAGKTYVLTEADLSKYIFAAVTPSNGHTVGDTADSSCTSQVDVPYFAGGTGVEGDPYIIENPDQLKSLSLFPNAHYRLENDITGLDDVLCDSYVSNGPFNGDFNGNGHTVTIDITDSNGSYLGMFSTIESSGKVHDLNVSGSISGSKNIGSLAGLNKGTISDCNSSAAVSATGSPANPIYVGGLVSSNMGRIAGCGVTGTVTASGLTGTGTASSRAVFGGIAGENFCLISEGLITGCYTDIAPFSIDVSTFREVYVGGLVGNNYGGGSIVDSHGVKGLACSLTTGDEASMVRVGGIAGYNYYASILRCFSTGDVTADGKCTVYTGGIAGQCSNGPISQASTISECYHWGAVSGNGDSTRDTCVGGLVGYFTSGDVNYCYSAGSISADGGSNAIGNVYAGGLIGYGDKGTMRYSYSRSTGTAEGGSAACNGGLYGGRKGTSGSNIPNCYWNSDNTDATYGDGKNGDYWDAGTVLTITNMTGTQAAVDMVQLDFETPFFVTRENYQKNLYYPQLCVFAYSTDNTVSDASMQSVTEVVYSASISPDTVDFDLSNPEDVSVAVNWNDATAVRDIKAGEVSIGTISYSIDSDKNLLTIANNYLETQHLGAISLTIEFNKGYPAVLNINITRSVPTITASPEDSTVTVGETVSFTVAAIGDEPLSYQWLKNGSSLPDGERVSGAKTETLTIIGAQESDSGSYTCFVSNNTGGATSSAAALMVNPAPVAPHITTEPSSIAVNYWETATFTVEASGDAPIAYQWLKNGSDISDGSRISGASTKTLTITDARASDEGSYTCHISNGAGNVTSDGAALTVNLVNATISPSEVAFDLDNPADISTTISWGSARTVTDVVYGSDTMAGSAIYSIDDDVLNIGNAFLEDLKLSENDTVDFEIIFDLGNSATLTVEAVRNYIPSSDATLSDLAVGGVTVSDFAPEQYEYDVELPYGTLPGSAAAHVSTTANDELHAQVNITPASAIPGSATVEVTAEDGTTIKIYTINFTLGAAPTVSVASITISGAGGATVVEVGSALQMLATVLPSNATNKNITWSIESGSGASIDASGLLTATNPGAVTVRATAQDGSGVYGEEVITITTTYSITVQNDGHGTGSASPTSAAQGTTITLSSSPNSGYHFKEWQVESPVNLSITGNTFTMPDEAVTVRAAFEADAVTTCTVTFNSDGSVYTTKTVQASTSIGSNHWPTNPTKSGYTFGGWFTGANGSGSVFTSATPVNVTMTVYAKWTFNGSGDNEGGDGDSGSSTSTNNTPAAPNPSETPKTETIISGNTLTATTTTTATVDSSGRAAAAVTQAQISDAVGKAVEEAAKQGNGVAAVVEIKVEAPATATAVETSLPKAAMDTAAGSNVNALTISTSIAAITFDAEALDTMAGAADADIKISTARVDAGTLSEEAKQLVGDRPVFDFSVSSGDKVISQFGGNVSVSVPYTPKPGEDTNAIVIYYINAEGKPEIVSNCAYDSLTGTISFTTNHFSKYAVGYNKVSFKDVAASAWYSEAVGFIAARGITAGTGSGNFCPEAKLNRGEFLVMLMRAYGMEPDISPKDNFADAGNTYYTGYLAAAKRLGISGGVGSNLFAPEKEITRQEMCTLLYNALEATGELPQGNSGKQLSGFSDAGQVASWAKDAVTLFVKSGTIGGIGGKLSAASTTTRAQMAQVLYNLLAK